MPSVDELLNAEEITEATLTETNDVIEIDADTRTMIIPDTERIFGVMSDEKGERKYFRCKRFVGNGIDLSKLDFKSYLSKCKWFGKRKRQIYCNRPSNRWRRLCNI